MGGNGQESFREDEFRGSSQEFISTAVHDLREALRMIRANSELLAHKCSNPTDEVITRSVRFLQDGVLRMETLIHGIAEYCYAEVRAPEVTETDLEAALLEAQRQLGDEVAACRLVVTHDALPSVKADFFGLTAVFRSLIENSCKFRGAADPRVHVSANSQGPEWVISVRDNGLGFNPDYRERIFKPFERLSGKQYPGSGLGLALARRIVEQHGGRMWADSTLGEGSVFSFSLPASD
jgi:light-regulated signal transduction histidine kinase (bacteriophytochrome)